MHASRIWPHGSLAAPLGLQPKREAVTPSAPVGDLEGWSVVVYPGDEVRELYEGSDSIVVS